MPWSGISITRIQPGTAPVRETFTRWLINREPGRLQFQHLHQHTTDARQQRQHLFRVSRRGHVPAPVNTTQSGFARITQTGTVPTCWPQPRRTTLPLRAILTTPRRPEQRRSDGLCQAKSVNGAVSYLRLIARRSPQIPRLVERPAHGNLATVTDDSSTASPVAPDNDVYFGSGGGSVAGFSALVVTWQRKRLAHSAGLTPPSSRLRVPSKGRSSLSLAKHTYALRRRRDQPVALLDPNAIQPDPHTSAVGFVEMRGSTLMDPHPWGLDPQPLL